MHNIIITTMAHKILLTLLLQLTVAFSAFAQTEETKDSLTLKDLKYLTIKGVELKPGLLMEDALKVFLKKGLEKDTWFDKAKEEENAYWLKGTFFNTRNCEIYIYPTTNDKNIVGKILITFPEDYSFKSLKRQYDELKYSLSQKYHMFSCIESFDDEYLEKSNDDELKLLALSKNEATFDARFYASDNPITSLLGYIVLRIDSFNLSNETRCHVTLSYVTSDDVIEQMTKDNDL